MLCFNPGHRCSATLLTWNSFTTCTFARDIANDSYLVARRDKRCSGTSSLSAGLRPHGGLAQQGGPLDSPIAAISSTPPHSLTWMTCRRCKQRFAAENNHQEACRYHSEGWTGGELAKAVGFVRRSDAPEHQLAAVMGRTGLLRFWDCCGAEDEDAPGCKVSFHVAFDETENDRRGWR
ncbi:hypothetical protein Vafri_12217 [Volvox africanus]|uniref:Uncharacterized protein n=1 Tax=Volvox africanus TaxID=51714 RepID=A0A8J4B9I8_9CHLO|nr:hypothetical protein Vafri_12217 [Volvox africanus]